MLAAGGCDGADITGEISSINTTTEMTPPLTRTRRHTPRLQIKDSTDIGAR